MAERVIVTIGTKKGVFVAEASKPRKKFDLRGPFGPGVPVYSTLVDTRATPTLYASSCNPFFGMKVLKSTDMGKSFKETRSAPAFAKDDGRALINIWSIEPGPGKKELWAGVEPKEPLAALAAKVERVCQSVGLEPERRAYHPHITLARWKGRRSREVASYLDRQRGLVSEPWEVDAFILFESRLSRHGAHYEEVASYALV